MTEIVTVPAGVIQPRELLLWLKRRKDEARDEQAAVDDPWDEAHAILEERIQTYSEVIQHVSFGTS
jgi:hypothetical protein